MRTRSAQTTYEKFVATVLVLLIAAAGWGPFAFTATSLAFVEAALLPMALAMAVLSLGMVYDAAERLLGRGRGVYAAAVFCTLPATGMIAASPGALPAAGLMLISSVTVWMAARASGDERPFYLGMLAALLLFGGYLFGVFPGSLVLPFAGWLAARQGRRQIPAAAVTIGAWTTGVVLHRIVNFGLPTLGMIAASDAISGFVLTLPLLPWIVFAVFPVFKNFRRVPANTWRLEAALAALAAVGAGFAIGASTSATGAAVAPLLAVLATSIVTDDFVRQHIGKRANGTGITGITAVLLLMALPLVGSIVPAALPPVSTGFAVAAVVLAMALLWTVAHNAPRWSFGLLCGGGMLVGRLLDQQDPLTEAVAPEYAPLAGWVVGAMLGIAAMIWIGAYAIYSMQRRHRQTTRDTEQTFGTQPLRNFAGEIGSPAAIAIAETGAYSFAIFGDVTGAESPFSTRRGGYYAFQSLQRGLAATQPAFAVSVGDLASSASPGAYRNLRRLLKSLPVPLALTPGNHDLFRGHTYDAAPFHALFGADNSAFEAGPVKFVILNNAWGSLREAQWTWLQQELQTALPFTLLFCHKPPFDFRPDAFYAMEDRAHAERLHALCCDHRVTAVISGHIHTLMAETVDRITYVITGGGGSKLASKDDHHHFLQVHVTPGEVYMRVLPLQMTRIPNAAPLLELRLPPRT